MSILNAKSLQHQVQLSTPQASHHCHTTFTITGEPMATIKEVVEEPPTSGKTNTQSISTGVQADSHGYQHTSMAVYEGPNSM